jgi:hypothetical protein
MNAAGYRYSSASVERLQTFAGAIPLRSVDKNVRGKLQKGKIPETRDFSFERRDSCLQKSTNVAGGTEMDAPGMLK